MAASTPSRRTLLATALATGATFALRSRAADAPASPVVGTPTTTLRWGIIGTGTRGLFTHVRVQKESPDSSLLALCDVSESRLQSAVSAAPKGATAYADYQKLLANPDINAVVIATPNLLHREMLAAALQAGKHVLCEKPMGVSFSDAATMTQAATSAKTVVMFGMQYRNQMKQQKIHEMVEKGSIGKPRFIVQTVSRGDWNLSPNVWQYSDPKLVEGKPRNWRLSQAASGGTLNEFSCHYFDLIHWMAGYPTPERISCDGGISVYKDGRDTWDHASVTMKYADNVTAVHTLCLFGPGRNDISITGDEGTIATKAEGLQLIGHGKKSKAKMQEVKVDEPAVRGADYATLRLYQDFLECVKTGKKPEATAARATAASRTCWLAELSSERKAEVKWDDA